MVHFLLNRYANAGNPNKIQRTMRECNTSTTIYDKADIAARKGQVYLNKRARWRADAIDQVPPERVYMAVSDTPPGMPEVGVSNSYIVTQSSNSRITWDPKLKRWVPASYSQKQQALGATVRQVASGWGNGKSRQGGAA